MFRTITTTAFAAVLPLAAAAQDATTLTLIETEEYGSVLALEDATPVYTFYTDVRGGDGETPLDSCNEPCQEQWPLVTASGEPAVGAGLDAKLLSTIDWQGQTVVQYDSQPLFTFRGDEDEDEPTGQEVHTHGGWWYLIDANGHPVVTGVAPNPMDPADRAPESGQPG